MIEIHDCLQGGDIWLETRKGKLTASQFGQIVSSKSLKIAKLKQTATHDEIAEMSKRAKKQLEVYNQLLDRDCQTNEVNASGLKGLIEKGFADSYEDYNGCSLLGQTVNQKIDELIAETIYTEGDLGERLVTFAMQRGTRLEPIARTDFEMRYDKSVSEVGFVVNTEIGTHIGASPDGLIDDGKSGIEIKCPLPPKHITYLRQGGLPSEYKAQVHGCMALTGAESWWFYSFCPNLKELAIEVHKDNYTENLIECLKEFNALYDEEKKLITKYIN